MERHYQNSTSDSAMTEIALALAMGFFSIMVLTMVSMGAGKTEIEKSVVTAALQVAADDAKSLATTDLVEEDLLVIFYNDGFFDQDLNPISPSKFDQQKRLILAFPPDLKMNVAIEARAKFNTKNLIISTLNDEWMTALRRTIK